MATTRIVFDDPGVARKVPSVTMPEYKEAGTNFLVPSYSFADGATEAIQVQLGYVPSYGSGNITCKLVWYADTATTGNVVLGAQIACVTPETDTQDVETKSLATENTVTDSHLGTTAQRLHIATITISNLDSITTADVLWLRVHRKGGDASDTMSGDLQLVAIILEWSDT